MRPIRRRRMLLVLALPVGLVACVLLSSNRLTGMYFAPKPGCEPPPADAAPCEVVHVPVADGSHVEGWFFPARPGPDHRPRAIVVLAHGNGWNLEKQWRSAWRMAQRGFDVIVFDYRGFGNSPGSATRASAIEDIETVIAWARERARPEGLPVVLLGQSMGAALSIEVGARDGGLAAIVLDSPFDSWPGIAATTVADTRWGRALVSSALRPLLRVSGRDPADVVGQVDAPMLIVTGLADEVCPPSMSRSLARASSCRLLEIDGAGHVGRRTEEQARLAEDTAVAFIEEAIAP